MAVNASGVQLVDPTFVTTVDAALAAARLPADQLTIEVTETASMRCPETASAVLIALSERGILLSLDDFGTGYSPLTALRDLPAGVIKLDRTFIAGLGRRSGDDLAAGIIQLGFAAGMHVVAEGIETVSQADQLLAMGCQFGQGYLWSCAIPASELLATVERIERNVLVETSRVKRHAVGALSDRTDGRLRVAVELPRPPVDPVTSWSTDPDCRSHRGDRTSVCGIHPETGSRSGTAAWSSA